MGFLFLEQTMGGMVFLSYMLYNFGSVMSIPRAKNQFQEQNIGILNQFWLCAKKWSS
jgi:hypothetical protein